MSTPAAPRSASRLALLLAALLCLPGLWLRFHALEWMEFGGDELTILYDSYRAGHEHFALHGVPASIGVPLPNFLFYLLALPVSLTQDPLRLVLLVALWNVLGLACVLRLLLRCVPPAQALLGTALLAAAPGPLFLSRKLWNPDFLFPGMACLLLVLLSQLERPRRWFAPAACALFALACGFHASVWPLAGCILLWAWLVRLPVERRGLALGALVLLLLFAPWIAYFTSSHFDDLRGMALLHSVRPPADESWGAAFARHAAALVQASTAGEVAGAAAGTSALLGTARWIALGFTLWTALACVLVLLRAPGILWRARRGLRPEPLEALLALGALFELTVLCAYASARIPSLPHYYAVFVPFPALAGTWLGVRAARRTGEGLLLAAGALVVASHALLVVNFLERVRAGDLPPGIHYASPWLPEASGWQAQIERLCAEVDSGHAAERSEQARLAESFERSSDVLVRLDPGRAEPALAARGRVEWRPGPEGLEILGSTAVDMLCLPEFALGGRGRAVLRLELWSPKEVMGCLFYATRQRPEHDRRRVIDLRTRPGTNVIYLEIADPDLAGRTMLRHAAARWVLRAFEARRCAD